MASGLGALVAYSCGSCGFGAGSAIIPLARDLLGTDYNVGDYTVVARYGACYFRRAFMGTVLGAAVGAVVASHFGPHMLAFGLSLFILGVLCAAMHSDRSAYRFAGVTLAVVLLVPRTDSASQMAVHRFSRDMGGV